MFFIYKLIDFVLFSKYITKKIYTIEKRGYSDKYNLQIHFHIISHFQIIGKNEMKE